MGLSRLCRREHEAPTKQKRGGDLKSILPLALEMQSFEFAQLVFSLALVQYFLIILPFGMTVYILSHYMLEVCDLLFDFDFMERLQLRDCLQSQKRL